VSEILFEVEGNVAVITVSFPEKRNAMTPSMGRQFGEVCDAVRRDPSIGAAVVRGAGGTFCSGADTSHWGPGYDPASPAGFDQSNSVYAAFVGLGQLPVPTVAAVRGSAVGAGVNLALAADLRIVSTTAKLIGGFNRVGLHPGGGFITLCGRLGGREAAAALALFGETITGAQAARLGMAWEAVDDAEVEPRARALAAAAAADPELSRQVLATFRSELGPPAVSWPVAVEMERGKQMWTQRRRRLAAPASE
jgi:enoyl-CoA hydratase